MSSQKAVVIGNDGRVIDMVDQIRAWHMTHARNVGRVIWSRHGDVVRIELDSMADDEGLEPHHGNPLQLSYDHESETNIRGVWALRRLGVGLLPA